LNDRWLRAAQDFDPAGLPSHGEATDDEATIWFLERLHKGQDARKHPARSRYFARGSWSQRVSRLEADGLVTWAGEAWALTDAGTAKITRILADDVDGPDRLPFAVMAGPIASGSAVVQDPDIWGRLKGMGARKVLGLEMEAATVATVASDREVPYWLVAKGVMDHADFAKDDRFKEFAARASAEVLFALLGLLLPGQSGGRDAVPGPEATAGKVPGAVKLDVIVRLNVDWPDLADLVGVPPYQRARFGHSDEPRGVWEWLEVRGRLAELPSALVEIGRPELADLLRPYLMGGS
jgi:nucleoside phosphorylase